MARLGATRSEILSLTNALGYDLSSGQAEPLLDTDSQVVLMAGGEGAGKSFISGLFALTRLIYSPLIWVIGPTYEQARPEFWEIYTGLGTLGLLPAGSKGTSLPQAGQLRVTHSLGGVIETKTSDEVMRIAARGPTGVIMAEAAQQSFEAFLRALGRITRAESIRFKRWIFLSGTFEAGRRWYQDLYDVLQADNLWSGKSYSVPTWDNLHLFPLGREDPQIQAMERAWPADRFLERFAAVPVKPANLVLKEFNTARHVSDRVQYDPSLPVQLWIDPGYSGSYYGIEVRQLPPAGRAIGKSGKQEVHIVDEVYGHLATSQEMIEVCQKREWWDKVDGGVIDIAGTQHHAMPSHVEVWASVGIGFRWNVVKVQEGIDRHRTFLKDPQSGEPRLFYNPKCAGAIDEYGSWKRKVVTVDNITVNQPAVTNCDALKAISYGLYDEFGPVERPSPMPLKRRDYPWAPSRDPHPKRRRLVF